MLVENTKLLKYLSDTPHYGSTFISAKGFYIWAKNVDHPGLINLLGYEDDDEESIIDSKGWIRCDSGLSFSVNNLPASFIELPEKEITIEQYEALLNWMIKCCDGKEFQISCTNGDFKEYDMEVYWPEDLIKIIKYYYKTGILKESVLTYNNLTEKIVKLGSKWQVQSEKGRNMGTYDTKEEAEKRLKQIEYFKYTNEELLEDTRTTLITKSRNQGQYKDTSRGKNRFERKKYSKVASAVRAFNQIDMNDFFKQDILTIKIPVTGETDSYTVSIKMEGVVAEIAKNVKNNKNKFEFRTIIQALTKVFNIANIYVNCTCPDYRYNFDHWNIINNVSTSDTAHDPGPGKNIRNPQDNKGRGCKHVLLVLNNGDWMMKVASVINNYVHYAETNMQKAFLKLIFPKIYGIPADEMVEQDLVDDEKFLDSSAGLIDAINEYGAKRGRYAKGTNKNPVTGTGGRAKKEPEAETDTEKKESK